MTRIVLFLLGVAAAAAGGWMYYSRMTAPPPGPGVPLALAEARARRVSDLRYDVAFGVPADKSQPVRGKLTATFQLTDTAAPLAFDFAQPADRLQALRANGTTLTTEVADGHVGIPRRALVKGAN